MLFLEDATSQELNDVKAPKEGGEQVEVKRTTEEEKELEELRLELIQVSLENVFKFYSK